MSRTIKVATNGEPIDEENLLRVGGNSIAPSPTPDPDDDQVNNPSHYQSLNPKLQIECIDAMRAAFGDEAVAIFCKCNAFKYTWRETSKNGRQDMEKARWYLNKYLELTK